MYSCMFHDSCFMRALILRAHAHACVMLCRCARFQVPAKGCFEGIPVTNGVCRRQFSQKLRGEMRVRARPSYLGQCLLGGLILNKSQCSIDCILCAICASMVLCAWLGCRPMPEPVHRCFLHRCTLHAMPLSGPHTAAGVAPATPAPLADSGPSPVSVRRARR